MGTKRDSEWGRKATGVQWTDVWLWLDEIRRAFGLWGQVTLHPPMPSQKDHPHGQAVVQLKRWREGGEEVKLTAYVFLPDPSRSSAQAVVLQLVVQLHNQLDREVYEAERASGQGRLPI